MATARAAVALAVHKPRGYVSERVPGDVDALGRPSIYSLLPDPSVSGSSRLSAVGRLDLETSGLMLFTDSPTLNAAVRGSRLPKTYVATVSGAGVDEDTLRAAITSMREPLRRRDDTSAPTVPPASASDDDEDPWTTPARARVLRRWRMRRASDEDEDEVEEDETRPTGDASSFRDHPDALRAWRATRRAQLGMDETGELRADGCGAVVDVEIIVREGRFHQVRRLVRRAGLRMRHLRRVAVGAVSTRGVEIPGRWRVLDDEEIAELICEGSNETRG